ncbi:MAG TPA: bifunctional 3-deoxy-7-phosphoheptulonate synthase/chorismate mutase type II [Bacteroidia bacterium]|nr:bifunctional 3-deoxy-7-phosphoheptulonate synthase/chorismate mutase type II [Bacteroidia bacterium]
MTIPTLSLDLIPLHDWLPAKWKKVIIAGPCGAESEDQLIDTARQLAAGGHVSLLRAGVWKPRTRPGAFEGHGEQALKWLQAMRKETGLPFTVEVANTEHVELALKYGTDVLWIGARTTVNPFSVQEIADALKGLDIPVLVKNPVNADLQLWIGALERFNRNGIKKLGAIHRGFHTGVNTQYRNQPKWEIPIALKSACKDLPVICDPSHICGRRDILLQTSQKALDLSMDGLMIEVHRDPATALSDAAQQLTPALFEDMLTKLVVRESTTDDADFSQMLITLRQVIDGIDEEIIQALARRMEVVYRIGEYKREHHVTILQLDRWVEILQTRTSAGQTLGIDKDVLVELCQLLHKASIRKQTEVMNTREE